MEIPEKLSLIVPLFNERENIPLLVGEIKKALQGYDYELILVNDGSTDGSRQAAIKLVSENVVLIDFKKNFGQSLALEAGIDYATGDYIITLDGDLQNDPADIPGMLKTLKEEEADVVTGIRTKRKDNFIRTIPSKIANWLIYKTTQLNIKDHGCGLKIFTAETAKDLNLYGETHRYINLLAHLNGAKIIQVPVRHHPRKFGKSKYGLGRATKVINDLVIILFQRKYLQNPIYLLGNIGIITFILGGIILLYLLFLKLGMGLDIGSRPLLILGVLLFFIGIQFFTTGIIIDLQMKTYFESQHKRPYKIRKIYKGESKN